MVQTDRYCEYFGGISLLNPFEFGSCESVYSVFSSIIFSVEITDNNRYVLELLRL